MARHDLSARDLDAVQTWWNTGDAAHEPHIRKLVAVGRHVEVTRDGPVEVDGSRFIDGLGSTEMGHSMFHITHRRDTERYGRCIGVPHSFVDVEVVDPAGRPLPAGQVGELAVRSPTLSPGYWNDSVTTYRTRLRGYFLTGDLVYRGSDGYYYHVDRSADAVRLDGGGWLYTALSEERILAACPDVADCTVSAVSHDGRVITDVLLILHARADADVDRTPRRCSPRSVRPSRARYARCRAVRADEIPTGVTGKVRKLMVRQARWSAHEDAPRCPQGAP